MKPSFLVILLSVLCFTPIANAEKLEVFVSIPPQKFLVERIGGDAVDVRLMLRPGYSPELYEPLPGQLAALGRADIYFLIGVPFEEYWKEQLRDNESLTVVECCDGLPVAVEDDPHVWTSPPFMIKLAERIKKHLQRKLPRQWALFERNHAALSADLQSLHEYIKHQLGPVGEGGEGGTGGGGESETSTTASKPTVFVVHPSWGHFTEEYGLRQFALEKHPGYAGSRGMVELVQLARREKMAVLFGQPQFDSASARIFAREIGARVVMLDPLAEDYLNNMRYVARQFAAALR